MSDDLGAPSGDSGDTPTRVAVPERAPREPTEPSAVRAGETGRSLVAGASLQSATTSRDALHLQEVVRTRFFVRLIGAFVVLVALLLPFIGGDPLAARLLWAGLAAVAAVSAWLGWRLRNPAAYRTGHVLVFGYACIFGGFTGIYYFGVFSPAVALIPVGIYFFSPGQSWSGALGVYITVALAQAAIMGAVGTGLVADRGLVRGDGLDGAQKAVMWLLLEAVYLAAFMIGRATRKATIEAIERHEKAVRALAA
ncbi:MAG TPA: hypothetical protein VG389_19420, partial [Myxococcota bacterium]|nr:hypothetical protein [Myxococcota bacterium]